MNYEIKPQLQDILVKLKKRDNIAYQQIIKKIKEVVNSDPNHYKNLRYDLKRFRRVHIKGSFVLVFEYKENEQSLSFLDYDHHNNIYEKKYE